MLVPVSEIGPLTRCILEISPLPKQARLNYDFCESSSSSLSERHESDGDDEFITRVQKTIDLNREVDLFSEYAEPSFSVEDNLRDKAALNRVKEIELMRQTFEEWRVCAR